MATLRTYWQQVSSNWFSINWGIQVEPYPVVNISVCEAFIPWYLESRPDVEKIIPLVYNSTMFVKNVVSRRNSDGTLGVDFYIQIDWPYPLNLCCDITVIDYVSQAAIWR